MTLQRFARDGLVLNYRDIGTGPAVFFQHGLGGDEKQVAEVFPDDVPVRRLTLECRGHGASGLGPKDRLSIATFAEDLSALALALGIERAIIGGISMGAAVGLWLAVHRPDLARGLILARPAWIAETAPGNIAPYALVADLLSRFAPAEARRRFEATEVAARLVQEAPDNLASLRSFFDRPEPLPLADLLGSVAAAPPGVAAAEIAAIRVPTLVIGHRADLAHPMQVATRLAGLIPRARLVEITPKAIDRGRYVADFRKTLLSFLREVG
ncbi:MAG: alpha/beta fold hydrolase [Methylobacteriaceae bacterium]|nr:alpha/beta fold hydrolase [Methylobacteriaceae bacterium]MBV9245922.1 alpha/beta fold hydrolase [Methylobacteriaceae bacterium]